MIDEALASLLHCPNTGPPMCMDNDAAAFGQLNADVAQGCADLACGSAVERTVQALLRNTDDGVLYPGGEDLAYLLNDARIVPSTASTPLASASAHERKSQRQQMVKYSQVYKRWSGGEDGPTRAIQKVFETRCRSMFTSASVLDVGNGGTPAAVQIGQEVGVVIDRFIALDLSSHMPRRSGLSRIKKPSRP